jgi:cell division protein ZapA (FtsZ GTPase activity inhibitor)
MNTITNTNTSTKQLELTVLGKRLPIKCQPEQKAELLAAVDYLDTQFKHLNPQYLTAPITAPNESMLLLLALNLAHECLQAKQANQVKEELNQALRPLLEKCDQYLSPSAQLLV